MSFGGGGSSYTPPPQPTPARQADAGLPANPNGRSGGVPESLITTASRGLTRKAMTEKTSLIGGSK
jgi:hypothetical protein